MLRFALLALIVFSVSFIPLLADKSLEGRACRSVHLGYSGPPGVAYYNEATIEQSAEGSY